jgi:hypothetical protein
MREPLSKRRIVVVYTGAILLNIALSAVAIILVLDREPLLSMPVWVAAVAETYVFVRWSARTKVQAQWAELRATSPQAQPE